MKLILVTAIVSLILACGFWKFHELTRPLPVPKLDTNKYWGPGDAAKYTPDTRIKPFMVKRSAEEITDLISLLNRPHKLTEPLEGINFEYGMNSRALEKIVQFWRDNYLSKWSERETFLNKFSQFTTEIQGLKIHYIHAKPSAGDAKNKRVIPLLLLHGWPGSVREFYDFIPMLTTASNSNDFVFEVIAPSLVGYGWSDAAAKRGFNAAQMAIVMRNLMLRVGHQKFLVQGGDWGSIIGSIVATLFPENVLGYHSNMCTLQTPLALMKFYVASFYPEKFVPSPICIEHHFPLKEKLIFLLKESGYFHLQATKPDTIGTALSHSPIGLAAYILEKFQTATGPHSANRHNAMDESFTLEAVLDNVMIYYLSNTATSAARFYAENMSPEMFALQMERVQTPVPMGCVRFKNDLPAAMDWQLRDKFPNLIHSKYFGDGGHFAALEVPDKLFIDFAEFVEQIKFELTIHFLHVKPKKTNGKKVLPLLLLHGWPGSVREFYDIIPMLTTPNAKSDYVFEVVAPSLPGYGWSQGSSKTGFGPAQIAVVMRNLMLRLGHPKFVVQGGDWGAIVGSCIASFFPRNVIGYHSNMCGVLTPTAMAKFFISKIWPSFFYEEHQIAFHFPERNMLVQMLEEGGYAHIQGTKPDTIGTALAHNPIGLAAYILEKFSTWTNPSFLKLADGGLTKRYTLDALLDNVMIYYITNSITTSQRLYAEAFSKAQMELAMDRVQTNVPTGCARFKHDLGHTSDWQLKEKFLNLVHSTYHVDGGHFAAMEVPETLYNDFLEFVKKAVSVESTKKEDL